MKNRNECGKYRRNPLFKRLAALLVLLFCVNGVVWGTPFRWADSTENAQSSTNNDNWSTSRNWYYYGTNWLQTKWHEETNTYPGKQGSDDVYFFGEVDSVCVANVSPAQAINTMYVNLSSSAPGAGGDTRIPHDKTTELRFENNNTLTTGALQIAGGTFNLTGAGILIVTGNVTIASGATLIIGEGVTLQVGGSITGSGNITNSGTISSGSISCNALYQTATGTIKDFTSITSVSIGAGDNRFTGNLTPKAGAAATITVTNAIYNASEISDSATGSLTISADGLDTTEKISLTNSGSSVTLKGALIDGASGSFYKKVNAEELNHAIGGGSIFYAQFGTARIGELEITNGNGNGFELYGGEIEKLTWTSAVGSSLNIATDTTIGELSISGVLGNPLKVTGTGTITSTQTVSAAGDYLKFENSDTPKVNGSGYFFLKNSEDSVGGTTAFPDGWKTPGSVYIWKGTVNNVLTNTDNWENGNIPSNNGTEDVIIDTATGGKDPDVSGVTNLKFKSLSVSSSSTLDLNAGNLTLTGFLENEGTIKNAGNISVSGNFSTSGILGATTISVLNKAASKNTVELSGTVTASTSMNVAGNFDVNLKSEISGLNAFNVTDSGNSLTQDFTVTLQGSGSLKTGSIEISRSSTDGSVVGKLLLKAPVELSENLRSHSGTEIEIYKSVQAQKYIHDAWSSSPESKITVTGTGSLTVSETIDLCLNGGAVNGDSGSQLNVSSGGKVTTKDLIIRSQYTNGTLTDAVVNAGTITVTGNLTSNKTWSGSGAVTVNGNFTDTGTWSGSGMITLSGTSAQTVLLNAATKYPAFTLSGAGVKNFAGTWKSTAITQNADITFTGDTTYSPDTFTSNSGVINFAPGAGNEMTFNTVSDSDNPFMAELVFVDGTTKAGADLYLGKDVTIKQDAKLSDNGNKLYLRQSSGNIIFTDENTVNSGLACTGTFTVNANAEIKTQGKTEFNNLDVSTSKTLTTASDFTVKGNLNARGTFSASAGTVTFTGDSKTISGDNIFYNVTVSGVSPTFSGENSFNDLSLTGKGSQVYFGAGKTQTINGKLTVTGGSGTGETITLTTDSASPSVSDTSTWWKINVPSGNVTLTYADVKYSSSENDLLLQLGDGITESEPGSTSNWFIRKYYWFGGQNTNWEDGRNWSVKEDGSGLMIQTAYPDFNNSLSEIVITEKTATNNSLTLTASEYKVKSISINENAEIDFAGKKLTARNFTNNGTLSLGGGVGTTLNISKSYENGSTGTIVSKGTEAVVLPDTSVTGNTITESGTWEFTGGTIPVFPQAGNIYYALVINGDVSAGNVSAVSAEIKSGKSLSLGNNSLSLSGALTNSGTLNINGSGSVTTDSVTNSGTIDISGSGTIDKLNSDSGLVKYSGTVSQIILPFSYYDLELANTSVAGLSVTDNVTVSNALTVSSNSIISVDENKSFTVTGTSDTATGSETLLLSGAGSANFTGAVGSTKTVSTLTASISSLTFGNMVSIGSFVIDGTTTLNPGTSAEFTDITINDGSKLTSGGNVKISGTFSDLNTGGSGLSSTGTVTFTGASSIISTASSNTKFNNVFVQKGKNLSTTSSFEVSGNFEVEQDAAIPPVSGTFTASAGTIVFSGSSKTVSGACGFNDVSFGENASISISNDNSFHDVSFGIGAAVTFANGTTQTVSGKVVSNGEAGDGNSVTLKSESGYWNINFDQNNAGNKLEYLNIKNSIFTGSNGPAVALKSVDGGNNTDWIFPGKPYTWTAGAPSDADKTKWDVKENWSPSTIPGKGAVVTIPKEKSKYPVLTANLDLYYDSNSKGYITINADEITPGSLDLGTYSLKAGEVTNNGVLRLEGTDLKLDKLTNNGLLKLQGNEDFGTHGAASEFGVSSVISGDNSTVEYYGTTASASGWLNKSDEYKNLVIDSGTEFTATSYIRDGIETKKTKTDSLVNNGKVIIPSGITFEFASYTGTSDEIEITNGTINHTGSDDAVIGTLKVTTKAILNGTAASEKTLSAVKITYVSNPDLETNGNVKLPGNQEGEVAGNVTVISGNLSLSGNLSCASVTIGSFGKLFSETNTISVSGDWTDNNSSDDGFDSGSGTVILSGSTPKVKENCAFNNLRTSSVSTVTLVTPLTVNGIYNFDASVNLLNGTNIITFEDQVSGTGDLIISGAVNVKAPVTSTGEQTYSDAVTIFNTPVFSATKINISSSISKNADGDKLTIDSPNVISTSGIINLPLELNQNTTFGGSLLTVNGGSIGSGTNIQTYECPLSAGQALALSGIIINLANNVSGNDVTVNGNIIIPVSKTVQIDCNVLDNGDFTNNGTLTFGVNKTLTLYKNLTNSGIITAPENLILTGISQTEISGVYDFVNLSILNNDTALVKNVIFPASDRTDGKGILVSGNFIVTGAELASGEGKKNILIKSSSTGLSETDTFWWWLESVDVNNVNITNAEIGNAYASSDISSKVLDCVESRTDNGAYTTYHWFAGHHFFWYGDVNNSWTTGGNWSTSETGTPVLSVSPRTDDETALITLKKGSCTGNENLLILENNIVIKSMTIEPGVRINLKNCSITADNVVNLGTVALQGNTISPFIINAGGSINHDSSSYVEFVDWGSGTINSTYAGLGLNGSFKNLILSDSVHFDFTENVVLAVNGIFVTNAPVGTVNPLTGIQIDGTSAINGGKIVTTGNQIYGKDVTVGSCDTEFTAGTSEMPENVVFERDVIGNSEHVLTFNGKVQFIKDTETGEADISGLKVIFNNTLGGNNLKISADTEINGNVSLNTFKVTGTGKLNCALIETTENMKFEKEVSLLSDVNCRSSSGDIIFDSEIKGNEHDLVLSSKTNLKNNVSGAKNITTEELLISDNCVSITTSENLVFGGVVNYSTDLTLNGKMIHSKSSVTGKANNLTVNANRFTVSGKINVKNIIANCYLVCENISGTTVNVQILEKLELNNGFNFVNSEIVTGGNVLFKSDGTITFAKIENTGDIILSPEKNISVTGKFIQTGTGKNLIYGSILSSESGTVDFAQNVFVYGNPENSLVLGGGTGTFTLSENLVVILESSEKELKILSPLSAKNIVLYKGLLSVSANVSSQEDIVLLGQNYSDDDGTEGHGGEFKYTKKRNADFLYKDFDEALTFESDGKLLVSPGNIISSNKNFYANGLSLPGSEGEWYLDVDKNADASVCFVEAYNCDISNCVIRYKGQENPSLSKGVAEACTFDGGKKWNAAEYENCGSNRNWSFADFSIRYVSTVSDNVLYVELSEPIRNLHGEFTQSVGSIYFNNNGLNESFVKIYSSYRILDQKGTVEAVELKADEEVSAFFLVTQNDFDSRWNTDAFGKGPGKESSTDSHGKHQNVIPSLLFARTLSAPVYNFTNKFGKILINSGIIYEDAEDKASPVLIETVIGQEVHTLYDSSVGLESQPSYDSHNFIEFRYSEAVDFNNGSAGGIIVQNAYVTDSSVNYFENQKVDSLLGAVTQSETGLLVSGLASIQQGRLVTGTSGVSDNEVHALYRKPGMIQNTIRLSIAGYTSGFVTDNGGLKYKNWTGYIDYSETPSGEVNLPNGKCDYIFDQNGNVLSLKNLEGVSIKKSSDYSDAKDYGSWDVSKPVFAAYRKASFPWAAPGETENYESVGSTVDGTSSLKRIEFHLFDNTPTYLDQEAQWVSKQGWVHPYDYTVKVHPVLYTEDSYAADDFGGSRAYEASNRTSGGIRYSTVSDAGNAFRYVVGVDKEPDISFAEGVKAYYGASSPIFQSAENPSRNPDKVDGVYFGYKLPETILSLKTQFTVSYDNTKAFVTDLAGNRLDSAKIRTMDLTPPSINMTIAPAGQNKIYIMFTKKLELESVSLQNLDGSVTTMNPLTEALPRAFGLYTIQDGGSLTESEGNNIDPTVPARVLYQNNYYMGIELSLKQNVTYDDIKNLYLVVKKEHVHYKDPVIDLSTTYATFIQDDTGIGNYVSAFTAHALSDFAVNLVNPLYAYNENFDDGNSKIHTGLYGEGSFGVHDFNEEQMNFGSLIAKEEIHVIASVNDEKIVQENDFNARIYIDNSPDGNSVSAEYNRASGTNLRVWLPEIVGTKPFSPIANNGNSDYFVFDSTFVTPGDLSGNLDFKIEKSVSENWNAGDQVTFMFGLTDKNGEPLKVVHSPVFDYSTEKYSLSDKYPMFALRLKTPGDLSSLDLWSIRLKDIINQKGNVTILNNVIDSVKGEKAVVKIDNPKAGKVDVIVMTLDGSVIDYLNRGNLEEGTSYFTWNGRNRNGKACARGMYFVRVIGNGFDETRKVMVVK